MKSVPLTPKSIFTFILFLLITFGFTVLFYRFSTTIEDKPAEEEVEVKYSKKGLFL